MRLLLIVNVNAQSVTPWMVDVIERALASEYKVDRAATKQQGHAMHLARGAAHEGFDLVVSLGGDGTVNEVANGLAGTDVPMAIIPGGGSNVLARSLGIPRDPVEATWYLISSRHREPRRITLGRANGRYYTFTCGIGFDGAIVREVEQRQRRKKGLGNPYYVWSAARLLLAGIDRRKPLVHLRWGSELEHRRDGLFVAISQKTRPFTYLANREMNLCPRARLELGLDCIALDTLAVPTILKIAAQAFGSGKHIRNRHALYLHDQPRIEITCDSPMPAQMDGEYIGEHSRLELEAVPSALSLLA